MVWFEKSADESLYKRWLTEHPDGFVLNHQKGARASTHDVAHRASCHTLRHSVERTTKGNLTNKYVKYCCMAFDELMSALEAKSPGAKFRRCVKCNPDADRPTRLVDKNDEG